MEKYIFRVKRKLENNEIATSKIMKYLYQLGKLPVTFDILKETSIGKTVNSLKKHQEVEVQDKAKELVNEWKQKLSREKQAKGESREGQSEKPSDLYYTPGEDIDCVYKPSPTLEKKETFQKTVAEKNEQHHRRNNTNKQSNYLQKKERKSFSSKLTNNFRENEHKGGTSNKRTFTSFDFLNTPQNDEEDDAEIAEDEEREFGMQEAGPSFNRTQMPSLPDIELPEVVPVYRPMPRQSEGETDSDSPKKKKKATVRESGNMAINLVSRKSRTQVFSGKKYSQVGGVPSLYQQCMRVLTENIDALHDTGGVPYDILEPLLAKCSPAQLSYLEECNPHFLEDTDVLWKVQCQKEFKNCEPSGQGTWRDLYRVKLFEREEKLRLINERITQSQAKKVPVRQAKLAYVTDPKVPSNIRRRHKSMYSTGEPVSLGKNKHESSSTNERKRPHVDVSNRSYQNDAEDAVPCPVPRRDTSSQKKSAPTPKKTTSRPMMQAALKMMKNQRGRLTSGVIRR